MRPLVISVVLLCALSACAKSPDVSQDMHKQTFLCDGGQNLDVVFSGETAQVLGADFSARLSQQISGSGIHYTGEGYDLRGKGPQMTWTTPSGQAIQCREQQWAMQQPQIQPPVASLDGTKWQLVHVKTNTDKFAEITPPSVELYTLDLAANGAFYMQLDCNRVNGQWEAKSTSANDGQLNFKGGAMTRAMCQQGAMDTSIATGLTQVRSYVVAGSTLRLILDDSGGEYVWKRLP